MLVNQSTIESEQLTFDIICEQARAQQRAHGTFAASQYLKKHGFGLHTCLRVLNTVKQPVKMKNKATH